MVQNLLDVLAHRARVANAFGEKPVARRAQTNAPKRRPALCRLTPFDPHLSRLFWACLRIALALRTLLEKNQLLVARKRLPLRGGALCAGSPVLICTCPSDFALCSDFMP